MPARLSGTTLPSGAQTLLLAGACFVMALIIDGPHGGDAACAAVVVSGSVGPGGSSSLTGELAAAAHTLRVWVFSRVGQESVAGRRNA